MFEGSRATVTRCTFSGNWNGVDDNGTGSTYVDSIFWKNTLKGGISPGSRYELDIADAAGVRGSFIHGEVNDLRDTIDRKSNTFDPPDPRFDAKFVPQSPQIRARGLSPERAQVTVRLLARGKEYNARHENESPRVHDDPRRRRCRLQAHPRKRPALPDCVLHSRMSRRGAGRTSWIRPISSVSRDRAPGSRRRNGSTESSGARRLAAWRPRKRTWRLSA